MKRILCLSLIMILPLFFTYAEEGVLILHRVFFAPVDFKVKADTELLSELPELLYALITTIQPIVRTEYRDEARSIITVTVVKQDKSRTGIMVELQQGGKQVAVSEFSYKTGELDYALFKNFVDGTAKKFSINLGEVKPEVQEISLIKDPETKNIIRDMQFAEAMAKPFDLSIWIGSVSKANTAAAQVAGFTLKPLFLFPFPLQVDLTWYFEKQQGLVFTLYFDFNEYMFFGYEEGYIVESDIAAVSENMIFLAGAGYTYRTLGVFSTSYSISLLLGAAYITATEKLVNHNEGQISLAEGESAWLFLNVMPIRMSLIYNINPELALQTNFSFIFSPYLLFAQIVGLPVAYDISGSAVQIQFFSLGVVYRF